MSYVVKSRGHASHQRDGYDAWWDEIQLRIEFINKEVVTLQRRKSDGRRNETRTPTPIHMDASPESVDSKSDPQNDDRIPKERNVEPAQNGGAVTAEIQNLCEHLRSGTPIDPELLEEIDSLSDGSLSDAANMSDVEEAYASDMKNSNGGLDKSPEKDATDTKLELKVKRRVQSAPVQRARTAGLGKVEIPEEVYVQPQVAVTQKVVTKRSQTACIPMSARSYQVPTQATVITDWATAPIGYNNRHLTKRR